MTTKQLSKKLVEMPLNLDLTVGGAHITVRSGKSGLQVNLKVG